jgi:hypothetical protein
MTQPNWQKFERLVAAIHKADARGAEVIWDHRIDGRQFDVVLRFTIGAYQYLTVIECKDQERPVSVDQVEAFATKSRDVGAHMAVMVSSSGYQEGALRVAVRHHVEAFTLSKLDEVPPQLLSDELFPCLQIYEMRLQRDQEDSWIELPEARNLPPYLASHLTIRCGSRLRVLHEVVEEVSSEFRQSATSDAQRFTVQFPAGSIAYLPHLREEHRVSSLSFLYRIASFQTLRTPGVDPHFLAGIYEYRDAKSNAIRHISKWGVRLGFDTVLVPGRFYFNPNLEFSYYCKAVEGDTARMILIESYQHRTLIQADITISTEHSGYYLEITDPAEIDRLRRVGAKVLKVVDVT